MDWPESQTYIYAVNFEYHAEAITSFGVIFFFVICNESATNL